MQLCADGIPAFTARTKSVKPVEVTNLSLPPTQRTRIDNILLLALVPEDLHKGQKKFFDFFATHEMNDLFHNGIDGVKVKLFATSLDTPGRAEMLGMEACQSYNACCVCKHSFDPPIGTAKKLLFNGYRRYLTAGSRGRRRRVLFRGHVFQYKNVEELPKPQLRDDDFVRHAVAFSKQRRSPYLGHKSIPLLARWPGFSWYRMNVPDVMHGMYIYNVCVCKTPQLTLLFLFPFTDSKIML